MSHSYISKKKKAADLKSTAYTFTIVGVCGLIFDLFFLFRDISTQNTPQTGWMTPIVMSIMFLIFLIIGIRSFADAKTTALASVQEEQLLKDVISDFHTHHAREEIDAACDTTDENQIYFARYDVMQHMILQHFPQLEESFLDHIIETIYAELYL